MSWFRLHDEVADDPKVQRLAPQLFKTWINLLCLASRHSGELPSIEDIAFTLRVRVAEAQERANALISAGLLDRDGESLRPHNWDGRQYKSDSSTERVQAFRKRKGNVSVTPPDTDTEQKQNRAEKQKPAARDPNSAFSKAYMAYPRHVGHGDAEKAWGKAVNKESKKRVASLAEHEDFIYQRVMQYGAVMQRKLARREIEPRFIPHMSRWLNAGRYMDDPTDWDVASNAKPALSPQEQRLQEQLSIGTNREGFGLDPDNPNGLTPEALEYARKIHEKERKMAKGAGA